MNKLLLMFLWLAVGWMPGADIPQAEISNDLIHVKLALPDAQNGFYRGTRFDWSGVITSLEYQGHNYYGPWFNRMDPKVTDFVYEGSEIVAGPCSAMTGPAEEFQSNGSALGWDEAKPGETFIKIGVGVLRKDQQPYSFAQLYEIVDTGKWTVKSEKDKVEFVHELADPRTGYAYQYRKTISLAKDKPELTIGHVLKNTGRRTIQSAVYNHNFLTLDRLAPGPDLSIKLPYQIRPESPLSSEQAEIRDGQLRYIKTMHNQDRIFTLFPGFGDSSRDHEIRIENTKAGAGMRITGDRPLVKCAFWSIRTVMSVEPFIGMSIEPNSEFTWKTSYEYYTMPSGKTELWAGWRGPRGDGTSIEQGVPTNWSPDGALWKVKLPGQGHASPIVWGDRIFTVTAQKSSQERILLCLDKSNGQLLWQQVVVQGPLEKIHRENSYGSSTPTTDGQRVFVSFRVGDDIVVAAHDFATGKQLWLVRVGTHAGEWGYNNEPVLYRNMIILDGDSKGNSFLTALNQADGKEIWRVDRTRKGISYSPPLIRKVGDRLQLFQCGDRCVAGFDPDTGKQLWMVDGPSEEFVASPVYSEKLGLLFVSSSWPKQVLLAIRPDGSGDVTQTHVAWQDSKGAPYVPSMILVGEYLLTVNNSGVAFCYDAATGKVHWQEKLGRHHSSPVLVEGRIYFINDDGQINVIKPGPQFERIAQFELGEPCYASPAISGHQVFLRGFEHLFCIGKK